MKRCMQSSLRNFYINMKKKMGRLLISRSIRMGIRSSINIGHSMTSFLMDVEMKFMDGMSAAEEIRKVDTEVVIIFITNMAQYAIRGYAVDALDYVLKPVSYFAFSQRLSRAIGRMKKRETKMIMVSMKGGTVRINIANIYYIESQGHTLILHTILGDYETTGTMKEMEEKLADMNFCRGNKGYLINLAHVDGITDGCAMVKGERLVLSRARKKEFMEELTKYWGEVIK